MKAFSYAIAITALLISACSTPQTYGVSQARGKRVENSDLMKAAEARQGLDAKTAMKMHQRGAAENAIAMGYSVELLHSKFPAYPKEVRQAGIEGVVELKFLINKTGRVQDIRVVSSPDGRLSLVCIEALKTWRFRPILKDGVAVDFYGTQQFPFKLY